IRMLWSPLLKEFRRYDCVFTVFGPLYSLRKPTCSVVGFAQPWIVYPYNEIYKELKLWQKIKQRVRYFVQSFLFRRPDRLIVELPHVKRGLVDTGWSTHIDVVPNCISGVYHHPGNWLPVDLPAKSTDEIF